eukprot:TRINITY_DN3511_c3_g1_i1.p1 TRINITY_DN3511_c3_g1~~TRINITY_DN3511_c3_g1_i1.p1  ORF type:complete len:208 (+),score=17.96 TRINITY_DN3511_c3_g1_i1:52-675(+)
MFGRVPSHEPSVVFKEPGMNGCHIKMFGVVRGDPRMMARGSCSYTCNGEPRQAFSIAKYSPGESILGMPELGKELMIPLGTGVLDNLRILFEMFGVQHNLKCALPANNRPFQQSGSAPYGRQPFQPSPFAQPFHPMLSRVSEPPAQAPLQKVPAHHHAPVDNTFALPVTPPSPPPPPPVHEEVLIIIPEEQTLLDLIPTRPRKDLHR